MRIIVFLTFFIVTLNASDTPLAEDLQTQIIEEMVFKQENIKDLSQALDSQNGIKINEDSLSIRGVGENSRGISITDGGVSQTDVSGAFTFDIDTSDLEQLIVYRGPGSIYSVNGTGGVITADSKSVFNTTNDIQISYGSYAYEFLKANLKYYLNQNNAFSLSYTKKDIENGYLEHTEKESDRFIFKYGHFIDDTSSFELTLKDFDDKQIKFKLLHKAILRDI